MLKEKFTDTMVAQVSKETIDRHFALSMEHKDEFFEQLVEMGANVNMNHGQGLVMAVQDNNLERMELLLKHGADPTLLRDYALKTAVVTENLEALKLMYQYGKNMKYIESKELNYSELEKLTWCDRKIYYQSLPEIAIGTNNLKIAEYILLQYIGGEPAQRNILFCAIKTRNLEMVKLVFKSQRIDGHLMRMALSSNSREIIEFMMSQCDGKFPKWML